MVGKRVALAGMGASAVLAILNVLVGVWSESVAVVATGIEFAGDVLASAIVLFGMLVAAKPADDQHPYGHGRVETLAAFVVGLILASGGVGICWNSLQRVGEIHPPPSRAAIVVLLVAILVRAVMSAIKFRVGRRIRSTSLVADGWNDGVDILAAIVALVSVALAIHDSDRFRAADHYGGFAVGLIVVLTAVRVVRDASLELVDTMPDEHLIDAVRRAASSVPSVAGVDKVYARKTGFKYHVDLHVEVDPSLTVAASHAIAGEVRSRIRGELGWVADVLVHIEPTRAVPREPSPHATPSSKGS